MLEIEEGCKCQDGDDPPEDHEAAAVVVPVDDHIANATFVDGVSLLSHLDDADERERHDKRRGILKTISRRLSLDTSTHSAAETANGKSMARIKHLDRKVADLSQRLELEGEKNRKLMEALGTSNMTRDFLQEELKGTISKSKELLKCLDEALIERDELKKQNKALLVSCEEAGESKCMVEQELQITRETLDCTLTQKASIEASFGQLNVEVESVRADNKRLRDENCERSEVCDGLRRSLKEAQDEMLAVKSGPIADREREIINLKKELDDLKREKSKADVLIGEQENKLNDLYRADNLLREMNNSIIEEKALVEKRQQELEEAHRSEMALLRSQYDEAAKKLLLKDAELQKVHDERSDKANAKLEELASVNDEQRRTESSDAFLSHWESFANWDPDGSPTSVARSTPRTLFVDEDWSDYKNV